MPIYEYECSDCGHRLDALQKISEPVLVRCPACQEDSLKKLMSAPQFRLKGSGWYETDFKKDKRRNIAGDSDKQGSSAKPEGEGKKASGAGGSGDAGSTKAASESKASPEKKAPSKSGKQDD